MTDTALNTAKAGYLTRRLFDVAQDVVISEEDCGTKEHVTITTESDSGITIPISKKIRGRILAEDVLDANGNIVFKKGYLISKHDAKKVEDAGVLKVDVRSPLVCKSIQGVCGMCYGLDLGKNKMVDVGEAVGTVAAQAIGEPGTQLTMRTFHAGGVAVQGGDITQGLPRVEEVFEKRMPKNPALVSQVGGTVTEIKDVGKERLMKVLADVEEGKKKPVGEIEYYFSLKRAPTVRVGDRVEKGQILTDGSASIDEMFKYGGKERAQNYIITEVNKLYELQGETVSRKHIEIIVKQMFSPVKIKAPGDTEFAIGEVVNKSDLDRINKELKKKDKEPATGEAAVLGITEVSLSRRSFLSAASFQHTNRILIQASVRGSKEELIGLKENVIIGRLIPAGTGWKGSEKHAMIEKLQETLPKKQSEINSQNY
jgi:DNA-directed RNA polymerase subunit beta'